MTRSIPNATDAEIARILRQRDTLEDAATFLGTHRRNLGLIPPDLTNSAERFHELARALEYRPNPEVELANQPANQHFLDALSLVLSVRDNPSLDADGRRDLIDRIIDSHPQLRNVLEPQPTVSNEPPTDLIDNLENIANYMVKALDRRLRMTRGEDVEPADPEEEQQYLETLQRTQQYFRQHDFKYQQLVEDSLGTSVYELSLLEFGCAMWGTRQQVPVNATELSVELGIRPEQEAAAQRNSPRPSMKPTPGGD